MSRRIIKWWICTVHLKSCAILVDRTSAARLRCWISQLDQTKKSSWFWWISGDVHLLLLQTCSIHWRTYHQWISMLAIYRTGIATWQHKPNSSWDIATCSSVNLKLEGVGWPQLGCHMADMSYSGNTKSDFLLLGRIPPLFPSQEIGALAAQEAGATEATEAHGCPKYDASSETCSTFSRHGCRSWLWLNWRSRIGSLHQNVGCWRYNRQYRLFYTELHWQATFLSAEIANTSGHFG